MKKKKASLLLHCIRGSIGKRLVVKHYKNKVVISKFPDMSLVIASAGQRKCRNLFAEAVAYARTVIASPVQKREWKRKCRIKYRVFNRVISEYILAANKALEQRPVEIDGLIRDCFIGRERTAFPLKEAPVLFSFCLGGNGRAAPQILVRRQLTANTA